MARKEMVDDNATLETLESTKGNETQEMPKEIVRIVTIEEMLNIINQKLDYLHELISKKD